MIKNGIYLCASAEEWVENSNVQQEGLLRLHKTEKNSVIKEFFQRIL